MKHFQLTQNIFCSRFVHAQNAFWIILTLLLLIVPILISCATSATSPSFKPTSINEIRFRDRSRSKHDDDVRVTVAVPSADENKALFSANLALKEIQPIWVKVENHVRSMSFRNPILPHTAFSGFIFTNLDEGEKVVQIDLIANKQIKFFTFFVQIPGIRVDYQMVDFDSLYSAEEIVELDEAELRTALEKMPCCTTNEEGTDFGDPVNLVIIGDFLDVAATFSRRGWLPAEETYSTAIWKTIKSFLCGLSVGHGRRLRVKEFM